MAAKKRRKSKKAQKKTLKIKRYLRGGVFLFGCIALVLVAGSYFMRREVIARLQQRTLATSSMVLSRPFPITSGTNYNFAKIENRLKRLGYQKTTSYPRSVGQFAQNDSKLYIFLRGFTLPNGEKQKEVFVEAELDDATIINLEDVKYRKKLPHIWLEPEILSVLGNSSTRAISYKKLSQVPELVKKAVISIEDERFYLHHGIDFLAILRAIYVNLSSGELRQGASTLTQQLAKNLFFSSERSLRRKALEAISAIFIETAFSKDQILEYYLNEIYLGQEGNVAIHGFGEAAKHYFGKELEDLSLSEIATLAGIIKGPSLYSPRKYSKRAATRRDIVLSKMRELGTISEKQLANAERETLNIVSSRRNKRIAPYFVDYLRKEVEQIYSKKLMSEQILNINTGIDYEFQACAEYAVNTGLKRLDDTYPQIKKSRPPLQAALIALNPITGEIRAWVGGRDYASNQFDRISLAKRQPGSTFKPFVYLTALDRNLNDYRVARTTSLLVDEPIKIKNADGTFWQPKNYDGKFRGEVTVRQALTFSLNIPTVELAGKVGIDSIANTAELFGFGANLPRVPSLALGAGEVTPLAMARAYAALANGGTLLDLVPFYSVSDSEKDEIVFRVLQNSKKAASESAVFVLTNMLQSVIEHGTGNVVRKMGFEAPAAGKTGTSNDTKDAWFAGYTPRLLAISWVGFDNNQPTKLTGASGAAPIWTLFMNCVSKMEPELDFIPPPDVVFEKIDPETGLLYSADCNSSNYVTEIFVKGTEPITTCPRDKSKSWELPWDRRKGRWEGEEGSRRPVRKRVTNAISDFVESLF